MKKHSYVESVCSNFETAANTCRESRFRQKCLQNRKSRKSRELALKLAACQPTTPCLSAACPQCFSRYRLSIIQKALDAYEMDLRFRVLTLIYYKDVMSNENLFEWQPETIKRRLVGQLRRAGVEGPVIGSLEVDYHSDIRQWVPTFHVMIFAGEASYAKFARTASKCNTSILPERIERPSKRQRIKDPGRQLSYLFKSFWKEVRPFTKSNGKRGTRGVRLQPSELALSLRVCDRIGFSGLLFRYRIPRSGHPLSLQLSSTLKPK